MALLHGDFCVGLLLPHLRPACSALGTRRTSLVTSKAFELVSLFRVVWFLIVRCHHPSLGWPWLRPSQLDRPSVSTTRDVLRVDPLSV